MCCSARYDVAIGLPSSRGRPQRRDAFCARARGVGVHTTTIHLLGDAISPYILGVVSVHAGLSAAVLIMPVVVAASAAIWIFAAWRPRIRT